MPQRIVIIGGGAAGTAAAWALTQRDVDVDVEILECAPALGGVATTERIRDVSLDASASSSRVINDGVQGGATSYANTLALMRACDVAQPHWVNVKVSFGKGANNWKNTCESDLIASLAKDVKKFKRTLRWISRFEVIYAFISVERALRMHGHSKEFRDRVVYATTALFFGTGNQTKNVSSVLLARVFNDDRLRLYEYDDERFMSSAPRMFAFPEFGTMYGNIGDAIVKRGGAVTVSARVTAVERGRRGARVTFIDASGAKRVRECDKVIFACNTEQSEAMLNAGSGTSFMERLIFRNIKYYDDVSVTHRDEAYMRRHYDVAEDGSDMYFIKTYDDDASKVEMSFDLTAYQPFAKGASGERVYQSIFLNAADDAARWTKDDIDPGAVALTKWWRQFGHTVRHFTRAVPFWRFVQNKRRTLYAGSYTLVNTHEIAVLSGFAAAHRCGAPYPFPDDDLAAHQFDTYLAINHGVKRQR
jgi:predicted NAD/FAD-binding protein